MNRLDEEQKWNLYYLIKLLECYYLSTNTQLKNHCKKTVDYYAKLTQKINTEDYTKKVASDYSYSEPSYELIEKLPNHAQMINIFNQLPKYEQQNLINLACFIWYCKTYTLDNPLHKLAWERYPKLINQINNFFSR